MGVPTRVRRTQRFQEFKNFYEQGHVVLDFFREALLGANREE
jgi:hypothetical protein